MDYFNHICQIIHDKKNFNIRNIFVSHLQGFLSEWTYGIFARWRVAARAERDKQTMRPQKRAHCSSNNLGDYVKTHSLISTKLW